MKATPHPRACARPPEKGTPITRFDVRWASVRDSLWFVPGLMTLAAAVLAWLMVEADHWLTARGPLEFLLAFGGGAEGARGVLGAIAGTTITVTGLVFSITVVALQLASSQFTPRVLQYFVRDLANKLVLGTFIGTFTYSLLVLRTVRSSADDGAAFVPELSVGMAILLSLVTVAALIYYLHHAARSMQVAVVIDRAARETLDHVEQLFPEEVGEPAGCTAPPEPPADAATVNAAGGGYVQAIDVSVLDGFPNRAGRRVDVWMEPWIGEYVPPGAPLARIAPAADLDDDLRERVRAMFVLGRERTPYQDVELGLRQLADIALKALSPAINDPTTAMLCVDRLGEVLLALAVRRLPEPVRLVDAGDIRFVARETNFPRAFGLAFRQIRHYGGGDPLLARHLLATFDRLAELAPPRHRPTIAAEREAVLRTADVRLEEPTDRAALGLAPNDEPLRAVTPRRSA